MSVLPLATSDPAWPSPIRRQHPSSVCWEEAAQSWRFLPAWAQQGGRGCDRDTDEGLMRRAHPAHAATWGGGEGLGSRGGKGQPAGAGPVRALAQGEVLVPWVSFLAA